MVLWLQRKSYLARSTDKVVGCVPLEVLSENSAWSRGIDDATWGLGYCISIYVREFKLETFRGDNVARIGQIFHIESSWSNILPVRCTSIDDFNHIPAGIYREYGLSKLSKLATHLHRGELRANSQRLRNKKLDLASLLKGHW